MIEVEIRILGHINQDWSNRFGGLAVMHKKDGNTILHGSLQDQPELRGVLSSLADLGLNLISLDTKSRVPDGCLEREVI